MLKNHQPFTFKNKNIKNETLKQLNPHFTSFDIFVCQFLGLVSTSSSCKENIMYFIDEIHYFNNKLVHCLSWFVLGCENSV